MIELADKQVVIDFSHRYRVATVIEVIVEVQRLFNHRLLNIDFKRRQQVTGQLFVVGIDVLREKILAQIGQRLR